MIRKDITEQFRAPPGTMLRFHDPKPGWKPAKEFEDFGQDVFIAGQDDSGPEPGGPWQLLDGIHKKFDPE